MKKVDVSSKKRKTRTDKKRDVKPTVSYELKDCLYRISYITRTPVKDVIVEICERGIQSRDVIEYLSQFFRRDYDFLSTVYLGDSEKDSLQNKWQQGKNERVTTRFTQEFYSQIAKLSYALDVTPSKATALLLDASIINAELLDTYIKDYLNEHLDPLRMKELNYVLSYVKKQNPYNQETSWYSLLSMIYDEIKDNTVHVKETVNKWMEKLV